MVKTALAAIEHGLSVLPIQSGSKRPKSSVLPLVGLDPEGKEIREWKPFQTRIADKAEVESMFEDGDGLALICGIVSGHLELIDFDIPGKHNLPAGEIGTCPAWQPFQDLVREHGYGDLLDSLVIIQTKSGGIHLLYRCSAGIEGNQKLALVPYNGKKEAVIETRGEGGYFLTFPTLGYKMLQGRFSAIPDLSAEDRAFLLNAARSLNEAHDEPIVPGDRTAGGNRPGDDYNEREPGAIEDLLLKHRWTRGGRAGSRTAWIRPGKKAKDGLSATLTSDGKCLHVFSSNADPFEMNQSYSPFAVFTYLEWGKDWRMARQDLQSRGYGQTHTKKEVDRQRPVSAPSVSAPAIIRNDMDDLETFGEDFDPVELEFYLEPYLPKGKCILLDADGGTGKTSLAIAMAASFSRGILPVFGSGCEPLKTLYLHKGEDQSNEIETVYRANGGVPGMISYYRKGDLVFDERGISRIHSWITKGKFSLIVADAFFYFLLGLMEDTNSNLDALGVMHLLNEMTADTRSSMIDIRHTIKGAVGTEASKLGMGSVQFRNSHRGQLVARWHPEEKGVVVVTDEKGSLLAPRGPHFAYRRVGLEIQVIRNMDNPFGPGQSLGGGNARKGARQFLREAFSEFTVYLRDDIVALGNAKGFSYDVLNDARKDLRVIRFETSVKKWSDARSRWVASERLDPFGEDVE